MTSMRFAARLRLFPQEENHEETEQSWRCCLPLQRSQPPLAHKRPSTTGKNGSGELVWKNGTNELCWRDANWTPATGRSRLRRRSGPAAAPQPHLQQPPAPAAALPQQHPAPAAVARKVTYAADAFFDFDKSVLKPEGKAKLDDLISKVKDMNLEVIVAVGHTDSVGSDA